MSAGQPFRQYPRGHSFTNDGPVSSRRTSWAVSQDDIANSDGRHGSVARYPHIKDLVARAKAETDEIIYTPMYRLLQKAQASAKQASTDVSFKRQDRAYVEYLISSDITINIIPKHKDFPLVYQRGEWLQLYRQLSKQLDAQNAMFTEIRDMIKEDNITSRIEPLSMSVLHNDSQKLSYTHSQDVHINGRSPPVSAILEQDQEAAEIGGRSREEQDESKAKYLNQATASKDLLPVLNGSRDRPLIHPKPGNLHGHAIPSIGQTKVESSDALAERFSRLRGTQNTSVLSDPLQESASLYSPNKPSGPRGMPPPSLIPGIPSKVPHDVLIGSPFPQAPSAAYSPARNLQTPSSIPPPRSTPRSMISNVGRSSQAPSNHAIMDGTQGSAQRQPVNAITGFSHRGSNSMDLPSATTITAEELFDRLPSYNILIIDVRDREDFDQGHIFARSIMCIEPLCLKSDTSTEDLEERLVLSPEAEQNLFDRRNEFDLVVYYDQNTSSNGFLRGSEKGRDASALRVLHDTLYEFNYYKQLRRPPTLLLGGIDAWTDLVGYQALTTSETAVFRSTTSIRRRVQKQARPITRVPKASANSSLEVRRRRLRKQNPLDAAEEKAWLETAHNEGVNPADYQQTQSDGESDSLYSHHEETLSPLVHSYEDFLRKFPEPSAIQESMITPRPPPHSRPAPIINEIPTRPPPAVARPSYGGVSDRSSSQLQPASRQSSSSQPPLYTSRMVPQYLKLPRTGLINFSVTCYMNATIQCLLATIPLSQFFLDNRWKDMTQKNWKGSNGIMPQIFANLLRSLWANDVDSVRPSSMRNFCTRLNREWGIDRQQDAKEFFDFLIDCLHEDLNMNWQRNPLRPLSVEDEEVRERYPMSQASKIEWDRYSHREQSYISSLFAGQHASRLNCTTCRSTSTTYEAFYSISVEIPRTGRGDIADCLRSYCQEEMLSGDEVWKCPKCKCEREATKKIMITRAPQILVVHFKRFSASKTESARKVHTPIEFPLHGLNMTPYMVPADSPQNSQSDSGYESSNGAETHTDPATTPPYVYDAYAVMRHLGQSGNGGHYISLVKDAARGCWRKFDDDRVSDFDPRNLRPEQRLQNEQAYLVFYSRSAAR